MCEAGTGWPATHSSLAMLPVPCAPEGHRLVKGANAMGVMLGNGMYNNVNSGARYQKWSGSSGVRTLALEMTLRYADGRTQVVTSDASWQGAVGPITFNGTDSR